MSLFLAKLTRGVRKELLESVFRRFGPCSLQPRYGYAFVVYDHLADAEKALRSLNGKMVYGEFMNLSWSINQPKPLPATICDVRYGINSDRGRHDVRRDFSRSFKDYPVRDNHPVDHGGTHKASNCNMLRVEPYDHRHECWEEGPRAVLNQVDDDRWNEKRDNVLKDNDVICDNHPVDRGGTHKASNCNMWRVKPYDHRHERWEEGPRAVLNQVDDDRWNEKRDNVQKDNDVISQVRYDPYVPDNGDERGKKTEKCGASGHRKRDCRMKDASQGNTSYHSDHRVDNQVNTKARGNDADRGPELQSVGRLRSSSRSSKPARRHEDDRKPLTVENNGVKGSTSRLKSRRYGRNRRREKKERTFAPHVDKKARISSVSPHSDHMPAGLSMHSRSQSPVSHLYSDSSMSKSRSNRSRSRSVKPDSAPNSRSPSSSLQASLHRSLSSSPERAELSKEVPSEVKEQFHCKEIKAEKHSNDEEFETAVTLDMLEPLETAHKADLKDQSKNHLSISKEELYRVVKHYRMQVSDDTEQHLGVEDYFGSARLWPWGVIYYRRLKKGLISTENYARRVAQNNEFGITDEYIRSSSGWGEFL